MERRRTRHDGELTIRTRSRHKCRALAAALPRNGIFTIIGCLNVFGMALDYFILVLLLDIWPQNSYADFCFIKCGLNIVMRHGCRYRCHPDLVVAAARGRWWPL